MCMSTPDLATLMSDADLMELRQRLQPRRRCRRVPPHIPPPVHEPPIERVDTCNKRRVYFDLETTGLGRCSQITQLAARDGRRCFCRFITHSSSAPCWSARWVTGIRYSGELMYHRGECVNSVGIRDALQQFLEFLGHTPLMLVGHNIRRFDCYVLLNAFRACGMFEQLVAAPISGFVDTLPLLRKRRRHFMSHKLCALHLDYFGETFKAHDAREDAHALQKIINKAHVPHQELTKHSFSLRWFVKFETYKTNKDKHLATWKTVMKRKVVTQFMAWKASGSGLGYDVVMQVYAYSGEAGVKRLLQQRTANRKPRVTERKGITQKICRHLHKELQRSRFH